MSVTVFILLTMIRADPTATLTGQVRSEADDSVVDVEVQAINVENGTRFLTRTNDEGFYRITDVPPGIYRLVLQKHGFQTIIKPGFELHVQDILALNFQMQIGSIDESMT